MLCLLIFYYIIIFVALYILGFTLDSIFSLDLGYISMFTPTIFRKVDKDPMWWVNMWRKKKEIDYETSSNMELFNNVRDEIRPVIDRLRKSNDPELKEWFHLYDSVEREYDKRIPDNMGSGILLDRFNYAWAEWEIKKLDEIRNFLTPNELNILNTHTELFDGIMTDIIRNDKKLVSMFDEFREMQRQYEEGISRKRKRFSSITNNPTVKKAFSKLKENVNENSLIFICTVRGFLFNIISIIYYYVSILFLHIFVDIIVLFLVFIVIPFIFYINLNIEINTIKVLLIILYYIYSYISWTYRIYKLYKIFIKIENYIYFNMYNLIQKFYKFFTKIKNFQYFNMYNFIQKIFFKIKNFLLFVLYISFIISFIIFYLTLIITIILVFLNIYTY